MKVKTMPFWQSSDTLSRYNITLASTVLCCNLYLHKVQFTYVPIDWHHLLNFLRKEMHEICITESWLLSFVLTLLFFWERLSGRNRTSSQVLWSSFEESTLKEGAIHRFKKLQIYLNLPLLLSNSWYKQESSTEAETKFSIRNQRIWRMTDRGTYLDGAFFNLNKIK